MDAGLMVLGFLMSGPKTGYRIKKITGKIVVAYNLSLNQIYPVLKRLEEDSLVRKKVVIQTGKPNKHLYSITPAGKDLFYRKLTAAPEPFDYEIDFLTRMFFFRFLDNDRIIVQIEEEIASLEEQMADLKETGAQVDAQGEENEIFVYHTLVSLLQVLRQRCEAEIERRRQ